MPIRSERLVKSEKLEKHIQEIQQFVNDRIEQNQIFKTASPELVIIADTLQQGKLTVQQLGTLNERRAAEDILIKQVTAQLLTQLTLIEKFLSKQKRELETEHQQEKASLVIVGGERRRQFDETIRLINNDKASVIKEIKSSVNQSATDLLNELFSDSIICQLRSYVYDVLESEIVNQKEGYIYIRLVKKIKRPNKSFPKKLVKLNTDISSGSYFSQFLFSKLIKSKFQSKYKIELVKEDSVDANTVLTEYYCHRLSKWAAKEWENVCNIYAKGGLRRFLKTTYERFKLIPYLNIESSSWEPAQYIDIMHNFRKKIEKPNCETSYRKISLFSFIFGRIRNNLMPFLTISFLLSILGIANRRQIAQWFFQPVFSAFEYAPLPTIIILLLIINFLRRVLLQTYSKHILVERKKAEVKLKDEIFKFYLGLIQHLTDKIRQEILSAIEIKEEWMDESVQAYKQLLDQTNEAAERNLSLINKRIEQQKEYLRKLNQELGDIQKLQRNLS